MSKITYITTAIPYVNSRPHIGFALELVQADAITRYNRLIGHGVRLQTGTDENAFKNVLTARELNVPTVELVNKNAELFLKLAKALNISCDKFIRTTEPGHRRAVTHLWSQLKPQDIYRKAYKGLYCTGCEDFYLERDLVNGRCPDHKIPPIEVQETNYFFRLSAYQDQLEQLLSKDVVKVVPETRKNEVLSFLRRGLQDFSISRAAHRSQGWGIAVPGDPSQIVYVWVDALINYISGLGYGTGDAWRKFWTESSTKIHVIGKNVWKFHAVYWPALLLSARLPLPNEIVVHGFLTERGHKISKSRGNAIDPFACVESFGTDAVRYYLLKAVSPFNDSDFSDDRLVQVYNSDLANGLGNLVSRVTSLCDRCDFGRYKTTSVQEAPEGYHQALRNYEFDKAVESLRKVIACLNQDIDRAKPWEGLKANKDATLKPQLSAWLQEIQRVSFWLFPFLPETSEKIKAVLSERAIRSCGALLPRLK